MKLTKLFPRIIGETTNKDFDLLEDIYKIRDNPSGTPKSWVSNKTYSTFGRDLWDYPAFHPYMKWQDSQVLQYTYDIDYEFEKFKCQTWFNIYKKNDFQELHNHGNEDISTIFMVKGPTESAYTYFKDFALQDQYRFDFEEGKLLIFPSHMLHGVSQHQLDDERITIASNYKLT